MERNGTGKMEPNNVNSRIGENMSETTLRLDRPLKMVTICLGQMQTNCYIVENTKTNQAFVFDPGDQGERIMNTLEED